MRLLWGNADKGSELRFSGDAFGVVAHGDEMLRSLRKVIPEDGYLTVFLSVNILCVDNKRISSPLVGRRKG